MLVDKYRPNSLSEIIGNEDTVNAVREWAAKWANGSRQTPLLIHGRPGCGKTSLAHALAREMGWEMLETNASDVRNKGSLEAVVGNAATESTLTGALRLIVIDEVDGISGREDRGGVSAILSSIEKSAQPMLLIANDAYAQKLKALRDATDFIEMKAVNPKALKAHLARITKAEGIPVTAERIDEIVDRSHGDVRSAMIDLLSPPSFRDREMDIFKALGIMFKASDFESARRPMWDIDEDPEMKILYIDENIPLEYSTPEDIHRAFEAMSRADLFEGRIYRRQHWGLRRYSSDLVSAGVAAAKDEKYLKFTKYAFPTYLSKMSRTVASRAVMKNLCRKIGLVMHMSGRDVRKQIHLIAPFAVKDTEQFRLEESEINLLQRIASRR